ncbi:MAG: hypothetical protein J6P93_05015 [Alphaproteobacteria bacterium]|nr:hypothetical protein [Alphaproteobacteria bacterium]
MQQNKFLSGRSMLEMLSVLAIVGILSIGGLMAFRLVMDHNKANQMLDYMNRVFLAVKSVGEDDYEYKASNISTLFDCNDIIPGMPEFIYACGANKICKDEDGNDKSCVTNVIAYFNEGETGAAAALENKLELVVRSKRPALNRAFQKSDCVDTTPVNCSHGFSPCAAIGQRCSMRSWEYSVGKPGQSGYYTDSGCEENNTCAPWPDNGRNSLNKF